MEFLTTLFTSTIPFFIPFIHYLRKSQRPIRPLLIRTGGFTKLTARLKARCAHRLREVGPTELSSDTKTPDDHRFLKTTSGSLRSHKKTTSFTNTRYRLPLPRPTLGRGTPSPLYLKIPRIKDPKESNKRGVCRAQPAIRMPLDRPRIRS